MSEYLTQPTSSEAPSIGQRLAGARQRKSVSLAEVSSAIKLKIAFLEALEHDRFGELPSSFYTRSFIRMYGNYLGLDGEALAEEWSSHDEEPEEAEHGRSLALGYHVTLLLNSALRHKITAVVVLVCIVLLIAYCGRSDREVTAPVVVPGAKADADFLRDYQPVFDRDEPLPTLP
jgi:cytoskeletal protein RodZ